MKTNVFIGKFIAQTFHHVGRTRKGSRPFEKLLRSVASRVRTIAAIVSYMLCTVGLDDQRFAGNVVFLLKCLVKSYLCELLYDKWICCFCWHMMLVSIFTEFLLHQILMSASCSTAVRDATTFQDLTSANATAGMILTTMEEPAKSLVRCFQLFSHVRLSCWSLFWVQHKPVRCTWKLANSAHAPEQNSVLAGLLSEFLSDSSS